MVRCIAVVGLVLLLAGCGVTGPTALVPRPADPGQAGDVIIFRHGAAAGAGTNYKITFDGVTVAWLGPGQYIKFQCDPGTHTVGAETVTLAREMAAGQHYGFLASAAVFECRLEELDAEKTAVYLNKYTDITNAPPVAAEQKRLK